MTAVKPFKGGRVFTDTDEQQPDKPQRMRYPCAANECRMPGTIFRSAGEPGACAWHFAANPSDWPRITRCLADWECVSSEVNEARRAFAGDAAADPAALNALFASAWNRMAPLVPGWEEHLQPKPSESYHRWAQRLEEFLGGQVVEQLRSQRRSA